MAKAPDWDRSDGEERKLGEQSGLDMDRDADDAEIRFAAIAKNNCCKCICSADGNHKCPLDTRVVLAVNAVSKVLRNLRDCAVSKRRY